MHYDERKSLLRLVYINITLYDSSVFKKKKKSSDKNILKSYDNRGIPHRKTRSIFTHTEQPILRATVFHIFCLIYLIHFYAIDDHLEVFRCLSQVKSHPIFKSILLISYWTCPITYSLGTSNSKYPLFHDLHHLPCFFSSV